MLPPEIPQAFLPIQRHVGDERIVYRPHLISLCKVHFVDTRKGLAAEEDLTLLAELEDATDTADWSEAEELAILRDDLQRQPTASAQFGKLPSAAGQRKSYTSWQKSLSDHLYRTRRFDLYRSDSLGEHSVPGESERDFRIRLGERARATRRGVGKVAEEIRLEDFYHRGTDRTGRAQGGSGTRGSAERKDAVGDFLGNDDPVRRARQKGLQCGNGRTGRDGRTRPEPFAEASQ